VVRAHYATIDGLRFQWGLASPAIRLPTSGEKEQGRSGFKPLEMWTGKGTESSSGMDNAARLNLKKPARLSPGTLKPVVNAFAQGKQIHNRKKHAAAQAMGES